MAVVTDVILEAGTAEANMPSRKRLKRVANRNLAKLRPTPSTYLDFEMIMVLEAVCNKLGDVSVAVSRPAVEGFVLDFEQATWLAINQVFPAAEIRGCVFHWTQAARRQVQALGLVNTYMEKQKIHVFIRQLLALPFLPARHIQPVFESLKAREMGPQLRSLVSYIERQWMNNSVFPDESWSVFGQRVRTSNDAEGWHRRLNTKAGRAALFVYRLVPLLKRESLIVETRISSGDLQRDVRRPAKKVQERLERLWALYEGRELTRTG